MKSKKTDGIRPAITGIDPEATTTEEITAALPVTHEAVAKAAVVMRRAQIKYLSTRSQFHAELKETAEMSFDAIAAQFKAQEEANFPWITIELGEVK